MGGVGGLTELVELDVTSQSLLLEQLVQRQQLPGQQDDVSGPSVAGDTLSDLVSNQLGLDEVG